MFLLFVRVKIPPRHYLNRYGLGVHTPVTTPVIMSHWEAIPERANDESVKRALKLPPLLVVVLHGLLLLFLTRGSFVLFVCLIQ